MVTTEFMKMEKGFLGGLRRDFERKIGFPIGGI